MIRSVIRLAEENAFTVKGLDYSPIRGPEGNIEYLLWIGKEREEVCTGTPNIDVEESVNAAHTELT